MTQFPLLLILDPSFSGIESLVPFPLPEGIPEKSKLGLGIGTFILHPPSLKGLHITNQGQQKLYNTSF